MSDARRPIRDTPHDRGDVWLGDLLRALEALGPLEDDDRQAVARALGFMPARRQPGRRPPPAVDRPPERAATPSGDGVERRTPILEILEPVERAPVGPARLGTRSAVPALSADDLDTLPPFTSLLRPDWSRDILAAANETSVRDGPIDVEQMVERAARLELMATMPRRLRASLHRGVQLLIDIGDGMQPFRRDEQQLADAVRAVVGRTAAEVLYFRDCPMRDEGAGPGAVWTWGPYRMPEPRRPVLVLSDLGLGGHPLRPSASTVEEWAELVRNLARRGSRLTVLVPYPAGRWPPALTGLARLIEWDRSTSRTVVRHTLGRPG